MQPGHPETSERRVLLAVTGLSPQIVTETVYALAVKRRPKRKAAAYARRKRKASESPAPSA
jgi:hypothetical protein